MMAIEIFEEKVAAASIERQISIETHANWVSECARHSKVATTLTFFDVP